MEFFYKKILVLFDIIKNMLGFLLILPEDPKNNYLHLYSGLSNVLSALPRK